MKYLIKVPDRICGEVFIDIVVEGEKEELTERLQDIHYIRSLGIHESFVGSPFELVPERDIDFPDYKI